MRRRLAPVAVLVMALGACGGGSGDTTGGNSGNPDSGDKTFSNSSYPFTFRYPQGLRVAKITSVAQTAGGGASDRVAIALDEDNAIFLARSEADDINVTAANIGATVSDVDQVVSDLVSRPATGHVQTVGSFPAVVYDELDVPQPPSGRSRLLFLFDGKHQYFINCQSTPEKRAQLNGACDLAVSTLMKRK